MSASSFEPPTIGDVIGEGRFELLAKLGDGGTSIVFRARDRFLDREVALKLLHPRYVGRPEREQRLINEAEYLRRVQGHPHIVEYLDSGRLRDLHDWPWLATEVLSGTVLGWVLVRSRLGAHKTLTVARQILEALQGCHAAGIVHRDTTPNNLFELDDGKTIKLFDFSHAADFRGPKLAVGTPERLTGIFDIPGTHGYMGPEQVQQDFADPSMDVFGFGILLYELVTGQNPYANMTDRAAFIKAQREGKLQPPRLHAWAYQAPEEFEELVQDCTLREPSDRPTIDALLGRVVELEGRLGEEAPTKVRAVAPRVVAAKVVAPKVVAAVRDEAATEVRAAVREEAATEVRAAVHHEAATQLHTPASEEAATRVHTPARDVIASEEAATRVRSVGSEEAATRLHTPARDVIASEEAATRVQSVASEEAATRVHTPAREEAPTWGPPPSGVPEATMRIDFVPPANDVAQATARLDALIDSGHGERPERTERPEVTAKFNVPAVLDARRRQADPDAIGDWVSRNPPAAAASPAAAVVVARAPESDPENREPSHKPVELAFARPLELRETAPVSEPEVVQVVPVAASAADSEPVPTSEPDPGPVGGGRGWIWAVGGLALVLGAVVWFWSKGQPDQSSGETDSTEEISARPEIEPPSSDEGPALEPVPEVETSAGVEPEIEPQPKIEPKIEPKPKIEKKPQQNDEPKPDPCEGKVERAREALAARDWRGAVKHSANGKCWSSQEERAALRVTAYMELGEWSKCVEAGAGAKDAKIRNAVDNCRMFVNTEESK
jgi:hypothetical protein